MDEQLTISTPEQVAFHYELAGIGTRFVAALIDYLIIMTALLLLTCAMSFLRIGAIGAGGEAGRFGHAADYPRAKRARRDGCRSRHRRISGKARPRHVGEVARLGPEYA